MGISNRKSQIVVRLINKYGVSFKVSFVLFLSCFSFVTQAHPFTYSICKLYIGDQYISGNLEVSAENLIFFDYLNIDSARLFSQDEVETAAQAYTAPLSTALFLRSAKDPLAIDNFRMSDLSIKEQISIAELKATFISYSFTIKLDRSLEQLNLMHTIGQDYPLISSLLILEIEGKEVDKSFDNLASNQFYQFSFDTEKTESITRLTIVEMDDFFSIKLITTEEFLADALVDSEVTSENIWNILSFKSANKVIPFSPIKKEVVTKNSIELHTRIPRHLGSDLLLEWKKFNMNVKSIPIVFISSENKREFMITRYDRSVKL